MNKITDKFTQLLTLGTKYPQTEHPTKWLLSNFKGVFTTRMIDDAYIVIEDGRFTEIGQGKPEGVSKDYFVLDMKQRYASPLRIEAHGHPFLPMCYDESRAVKAVASWDEQIRMNLENALVDEGLCHIIDMGSFAKRTRNILDNSSGYIMPDITTALSGISVPGGYPAQAPELSGLKKVFAGGNFAFRGKYLAEKLEFIGKMCDQGADFIKVFQQGTHVLFPEKIELNRHYQHELDEIRSAAHKRNREVEGHILYLKDMEMCAKAGINIQHIPCDKEITSNIKDIILEKELRVTPTLTVFYDRLPENHERSLIQLYLMRGKKNNILTPEAVEQLFPRHMTSDVLTQDQLDRGYTQRKELSDGVKIAVHNFHYLKKHGVKMPMGSDQKGTDLGYGNAFFREMKTHNEIGIEPEDIIIMASIGNAILHNLKDIGKIEKDYRAHLCTTSGDPTKDIGALENLTDVMKDGVFYKLDSIRMC